MPTSVRLSPPLRCCACTANTGRIRNSPSIRSANSDASENVALSSSGDIFEGLGGVSGVRGMGWNSDARAEPEAGEVGR